jgi:hypothetical protein
MMSLSGEGNCNGERGFAFPRKRRKYNMLGRLAAFQKAINLDDYIRLSKKVIQRALPQK